MSSLIGLACSHPCSHVRLFPCEPSGLPVNNHTSLPKASRRQNIIQNIAWRRKKWLAHHTSFRYKDKSVHRMDQSVSFLGVCIFIFFFSKDFIKIFSLDFKIYASLVIRICLEGNTMRNRGAYSTKERMPSDIERPSTNQPGRLYLIGCVLPSRQ